MEKLDALIEEARKWRLLHKRRGREGHVEALAASIRIKALLDARKALEAHDA